LLIRNSLYIIPFDPTENFRKRTAKEKIELESKTKEEREELDKKIIKKEHEKLRDWNKTKEQAYREADNKDLLNIMRADTISRFIKSEDKQQSKTNINYCLACK
jgi:predicted SprT family Zn-dependent metalloprotease